MSVTHDMIESRMAKCRALHETSREVRDCYDARYADAQLELEAEAEAAEEAAHP